MYSLITFLNLKYQLEAEIKTLWLPKPFLNLKYQLEAEIAHKNKLKLL